MNLYSIIRRRDFLKNAVIGICGLFAIGVLGLLSGNARGKTARAVYADSASRFHSQLQSETDVPERITQEIRKAREILLQGNPELFLTNGYVVSALYYSDQFLQRGLVFGKTENDVSWQIIDGIKDLITPQTRKNYIVFLSKYYSSAFPLEEQNARLQLPLKKIDWGNWGKGESHLYAVDLFIPEGSDVFSISSGLVVLAENGWQRDDRFSTSSFNGGNTVIIFHPRKSKFYRYYHLANTPLRTGEAMISGDTIGIVGHTGKNASLPGHGNHLHLEIHRVDDAGNIIPRSYREIRQRITKTEHLCEK